MSEKDAVAAVWAKEIGKVRIVHLQDPLLVVKPRGSAWGTTGLYTRSYNKATREHQFSLLLFKPEELPETQLGQTMHLRALAYFHEKWGQKISFSLGFAIDQSGLVKRNSCSNMLSTGQREMTDEYYDQLVDLILSQGVQVRHDKDDVARDDDDYGLAAAMGGMMVSVRAAAPRPNRPWPAKTKAGQNCSKCLDKPRGTFCFHHA